MKNVTKVWDDGERVESPCLYEEDGKECVVYIRGRKEGFDFDEQFFYRFHVGERTRFPFDDWFLWPLRAVWAYCKAVHDAAVADYLASKERGE